MENATLNSDNTSRTLIRLEQTGKHGWRARGWSAFLTCMLLPNLICDRLNSYHLEEEEIVLDIGSTEADLLEMRAVCERIDEKEMIFDSPVVFSQDLFLAWKRTMTNKLTIK